MPAARSPQPKRSVLAGKRLVHAAHAVAGEVDGHVLETNLFQTPHRVAPKRLLHELAHAFGLDLDARKLPVNAYAQLAKAPLAQPCLGLGDHDKSLDADLLAVGEATCKASGRRLVPGGKAQLMRKLADFVFRQPRLKKGTRDAELLDGPVSRTVIAEVVDVRAFRHLRETVSRRRFENLAEYALLAQIATVGRILLESGDGEFVYLQDDLSNAVRFAKAFGVGKVGGRKHMRFHCDGAGLVSQRLMRCVQQQGGIDAAAEGDREAFAFAQVSEQRLIFRLTCGNSGVLRISARSTR